MDRLIEWMKLHDRVVLTILLIGMETTHTKLSNSVAKQRWF